MNFDPIHWAAVALGVLLAIAGIACGVQTVRLDATESQFEAYKAKAEADAVKKAAQFQAAITANVQRNIKLEKEFENAKTDLDRVYSDYVRLRKLADNRAKADLSAAAGKLTQCPANETGQSGSMERDKTRLSEQLGQLDDAVTQRLAKSRDEIILKYNQCLEFVQRKGEVAQ